MTYRTGSPHDFAVFDRSRPSRSVFPQCAFGAGVLASCAMAGAWMLYARPADIPAPILAAAPRVDEAPAVAPAAVAASKTYLGLLDPESLGVAPISLAQSSPLAPNFVSILSAAAPPIVEPADVVPDPIPPSPQFAQSVPSPVPRPQEFQLPASHVPLRTAGRQITQQNRTALLPTTAPDKRGFFEKLFGMTQPTGPVLAYAAPEDGAIGNVRRPLQGPLPGYDRSTAVYDIATRTVYMPNGSRLEAHSGLGDRLDDPRYVHEHNRGATPPHVYELSPREALFHGVQALRLTPVGGGAIFGRTGLLAHTYMLGPNGDSNGCVSFRNYNAFLQAYMNGEVKRLAVVARLN